MNRYACAASAPVLFCLAVSVAFAEGKACFESRKDASEVTPRTLRDGQPSVKCSPKTGALLWWSDPFSGTVRMGDEPALKDGSGSKAVVRPREPLLSLIDACGVACHDGNDPPPPTSRTPRALTMHDDVVPDALDLQHGRGAIWCLDCHHATTRNKLLDNFGNTISFNEPQKLCGKCHGQVYRDWRDGLHGKRIGEWASAGRKRWFVCTECHDPHDVQRGARSGGFVALAPEPAPALPKGLKNADHERHHGHGTAAATESGWQERLTRWLKRALAVGGRAAPADTAAATGR